MPVSERNARMKRLTTRLPGLPLKLHNEPSHALVDAMVAMVDHDGCLRYIEWEKCTSREEEIK
eukprot:2471037-Amphidinium_carterae.1